VIENLEVRIDGDILTLRVDLRVLGRMSKNPNPRRRTIVLASSGGTLRLCGPDGQFRDECLNMSVWRSPKPGEKEAFEREDRLNNLADSVLKRY